VNDQKVPHLFVATGASLWGADVDAHPWTVGWQPDYVTESQVYADFLEEEKPQAKVAVLYQNDAFGEDLLNGFKDAIEGTEIEIVAEESYEVTDPTVSSQMAKLASSDADTFLNITTPKFSAQAIAAAAKLGWKVLHILNNVGASKKLVLEPVGLENAQGIVSTSYFMDPEDPQWTDDPAMMEYKEALQKHEPRADPEDPFHVYGWAVANTMVKALEGMEEPTREAMMDSVRNMNTEIPILLPGIKVETSGTEDGYPIEAMQIMRFEGENWKLQGEVIQAPH
jgi:branched-chain amino acid transport system substrate-binding protein